MPRSRKIEPYFLAIADEVQALFNVVGPMVDDTAWNKRVCEAQQKGRKVRICGTNPSANYLQREIEEHFNLQFTTDHLIPWP